MPTKAASGKRTARSKTAAPRPTPKEKKQKVGPRKKDPPVLKAQKRSATLEAIYVIQHFSLLTPIEIEKALNIGRPRHSKASDTGPSGDVIRGYIKEETAGDATLARLMFSAAEQGLLDPQRFVELSYYPGIRRAILPVRKLLLQLAIRGETRASSQEANKGYTDYCTSLEKLGKERRNELNRFKAWKKSSRKSVLTFIDRLNSLKHYLWVPNDPSCHEPIDIDGYPTVAPLDVFVERASKFVSMIDSIQLDPMYELDADLPIPADTPEEAAEVERQLGLYLAQSKISKRRLRKWERKLRIRFQDGEETPPSLVQP